jgi:hypothetical protein
VDVESVEHEGVEVVGEGLKSATLCSSRAGLQEGEEVGVTLRDLERFGGDRRFQLCRCPALWQKNDPRWRALQPSSRSIEHNIL